ncbi:MAG TPA: hypothetical protein VFL14_09345 [Xanthomonadales bacterium]|nr:hypothetical protein [Xanthomonadales bacterium]
MSPAPFDRLRVRDVLWLAAFAAGNFVAAHAHAAIPVRAPEPTQASFAVVAASSGHSRPLSHRE